MTNLQAMYFKMLRIRKIEEAIASRYPKQEMRCPVHLSIGQEACAVGVCENLGPSDLMVSTHRGHAHYLAKGGSLRGLLCELYGKRDGCARGQGGSMHLIDRACGFEGSTSIVGGTIPVGVGLAFAKKIKREPGVVVICIGDAAVEEGVFHESANFVGLHALPVVFVLENNLYSCYTHIKDRQPKSSNAGGSFASIARTHGFGYSEIDGNDVGKVDVTFKSFHWSLAQKKPHLMVMHTYRHLEHCGPNNDDHLGYRDHNETKGWFLHDPLLIAENELCQHGGWTKEFVDKFVEIDNEINFEFAYALSAEPPNESESGKYEYATTNHG
jgi:TPP-dependent pyruvate/acetoin dehydrogenase alpha subunit